MAKASDSEATLGAILKYRLSAFMLGIALFGSGFSGLTNEVIWQRSLKRFLGGSETLSTTLVILVFLLGLGFGAVWMGGRARRMKDPLIGLLGLRLPFLVNWGIAELFRSDLSKAFWAVQFGSRSQCAAVPVLHGGVWCSVVGSVPVDGRYRAVGQ